VLNIKAVGAISAWIGRVLPDREFLHYKSDVGMQVIRMSTRVQLLGIAAATALAGYFAVATTSLVSQTIADANAHSEVAKMRDEVAVLRAGVNVAASRIEQRQQFIASLLSGKGDPSELAMLMPQAAAPIPAKGAGAVLAPLAQAEQAQFALVDMATTTAEGRYRETRALLKKLGLDPQRFVRQSTMSMGGPEDDEGTPLASADPKFKALFLSWKKLDMLQQGVTAVPSLKPVKHYTYTSGYGVRYDPFDGSTAMHQGVDLAGHMGEPIYAAADGVVVRAGWNGGYGNYVEIDHGAGITTRYGHMSKILVKKGEKVTRGEQVGKMGSTGRSTGSHLHYEVRVDGQSVNPMPFLEASERVLAAQDRPDGIGQGGPEIPASAGN
jgi:murein DD-endopeptidase MepM/ murein hydrolase activator NlpD